ncbi:MAG TPA: hypothetical protein VK601_16930 [Kofleriaceae bacterium]|nr:hypothetical protein [Kofleriaceae bacterium]
MAKRHHHGDAGFELVWQGRLHFGDAPGVYDDAHFVGLASEWPLTLHKFDPSSTTGGTIKLRLQADDVKVFAPSAGHPVTVTRSENDPLPGNPWHWKRTVLPIVGASHLASDELEFEIALPAGAATVYLGLRLEVDTSVTPGLLDDFVVRRLTAKSTTHDALLGFQYEANPDTDV